MDTRDLAQGKTNQHGEFSVDIGPGEAAQRRNRRTNLTNSDVRFAVGDD
jgi:hypothetical protein